MQANEIVHERGSSARRALPSHNDTEVFALPYLGLMWPSTAAQLEDHLAPTLLQEHPRHRRCW
jgi:hypothetical protein